MIRSTPYETRPRLRCTNGVVSTSHWLATTVGLKVFEGGGNAFDVAVAVAFALHVVEEDYNGLGGEAAILGYDAGTAEVFSICGQGPAGKAATIDLFQSHRIRRIPIEGAAAALVPGAFDAWMLLLRDRGTLRLAEVVRPAIALAQTGLLLSYRFINKVTRRKERFSSSWPSSADVYMPGGNLPDDQTIFRNLDLARTYERILDAAEASGGDRVAQIEAARAFFYRGPIAEETSAFLDGLREKPRDKTDAAITLTLDDLRAWEATYEPVVSAVSCGMRVFKCGPWTQGPVLLQHLLAFEKVDGTYAGSNCPAFYHDFIETAKLAYADRDRWYADPRLRTTPLDLLLSEEYAREQARRVNPAVDPVGGEREMSLGEPKHSDTCHFDIVDRNGNLLSATPSGGWFQDSPTIPGLGFSLNTRLQCFSLDSRDPNALVPGVRPRTTLTPGLAFETGGDYALAFGSPGGDLQDQHAAAFLLRHRIFGLSMQQAIDAPSVVTETLRSTFPPFRTKINDLALEGRAGQDVIDDLLGRGHNVTVRPDWWIDPLTTAVSKRGAILEGAASSRIAKALALGF